VHSEFLLSVEKCDKKILRQVGVQLPWRGGKDIRRREGDKLCERSAEKRVPERHSRNGWREVLSRSGQKKGQIKRLYLKKTTQLSPTQTLRKEEKKD